LDEPAATKLEDVPAAAAGKQAQDAASSVPDRELTAAVADERANGTTAAAGPRAEREQRGET